MPKVTRKLVSRDLNARKFKELQAQASLLGSLRKEVWHRFGSLAGVGVDFRKIRNEWTETRDFSPLPATSWRDTLESVIDDIKMYEEAAKVKVRRDIAKKFNDKTRKDLYRLLKYDEWVNHPYLCRKMRQYKKHGKTRVDDQIVLTAGRYGQFKGKDGNTWLKIPTFERRKRLCIPLNSNIDLKGQLRLILKDGLVEVHHCIDQRMFSPCGTEILGIDKGYTEAFADSEGNFHGIGLGKVLSKGTEARCKKSKARNKLREIAKKKPHKARNINKYNLGTKKQSRKIELQRQHIRDIAFKAAHSVVDRAREVRTEDLTSPIASKVQWKKYNRTMTAWTKGYLAEAIESVTKARGSSLRVVNAAYTSQIDSTTQRLEGKRVGDQFHHVSGVVSHADTNAAINIKYRADDIDISLYTPYKSVKTILLNRVATGGGSRGVSRSDRPSRTPVAPVRATAESELLNSA